MYSPSDADFLSVESVIFFFIGWNSGLLYMSAILLPDKESPAHCQAYIAQINTNLLAIPEIVEVYCTNEAYDLL